MSYSSTIVALVLEEIPVHKTLSRGFKGSSSTTGLPLLG